MYYFMTHLMFFTEIKFGKYGKNTYHNKMKIAKQ